MDKTWLPIAALLGALTVGIGAFGAHGLKATLATTGRADTFETANRYQMYHVLALVLVALIARTYPEPSVQVWLGRAAWAFVVGMVFFSGSLYTLALTNYTKLGAVAPIGGLGFILGWVFVAMSIWTLNK